MSCAVIAIIVVAVLAGISVMAWRAHRLWAGERYGESGEA